MRATAAATALLLVAASFVACSDGDRAAAPFPDGDGPVVVPDLDDAWTVTMAFSDSSPDPGAYTYLRGGDPGDGLPRDWKEPLDGPSFMIDLHDGREASHVSIRRSPPREQAAFRALLKGPEEAAAFATEASVQDPITTDPVRAVRVAGRDAVVGPLSAGVRALVVEGDPGLTVLTSGNRLANFIDDDGLVAIAESLHTGTVAELDAWLARVLDEEIEAQEAELRSIGDVVLETELNGRAYTVLRAEDSICIHVRVHRSRQGVDHWCARPTDVPFAVLLRPDAVGPGNPSFAIVAGIANEHAAITLDLPDGSNIRAEEHVLDPGGLAFFADVSGYATGEIVVTIDAERIVIDPADYFG